MTPYHGLPVPPITCSSIFRIGPSKHTTDAYFVSTGGMLMFKQDADYFRQRRRAKCISERAPFSAPKFLRRAAELRRLEQRPWPRNLFGERATITELMAEGAQPSDRAGGDADHVCPCGCRREHKHNVSQTLRSPYGRGFDVAYFWSDACKAKWNRERTENPATAL
jgi:hypothetical protein